MAKTVPSVLKIFKTMEYGPAREDDKIAQDWLNDHDRAFGFFIGNKWKLPKDQKTVESRDPCGGSVLATLSQADHGSTELAVGAAQTAHQSWSTLAPHTRARHLYSIARCIQKHSRLLAVVEALDTGKPLREAWDCEIPLLTRHFYYHAGWAQLKDTELAGWNSVGVVAVIASRAVPLMQLAWKVGPALAMGNTVVLKPAPDASLSALLFAEICAWAGLPQGVLNVLTGGDDADTLLATHPIVDKVAFIGSTEAGQSLRKATAGCGKKLSMELSGKTPAIVFDSADQDSAVQGVLDALCFNSGQVGWAVSRLLVQEPVFDMFMGKLKHRMRSLRVGPSLDKVQDVGAVGDPSCLKLIAKCVEEAKQEGAEVFQVEAPAGCYYPPTLITGAGTASRCMMEPILGPVLVALPFRTAKEAVALANNTAYGLGASVFTEQITLGIEVAKMVKAGAVWINCHNLFDAAAGFGGCKQSGYGRNGGKEGLFEYIRPAWQSSQKFIPPAIDFAKFGAAYAASRPSVNKDEVIVNHEESVAVDRTYKLYYGGAQKRPDGNYSREVLDAKGDNFAWVGESNRKDVRNAVEAANKAQPGWDKRTGFNRSQILYYWAENLEQRRQEFLQQLVAVTGQSEAEAGREVDTSLARLFHWAAMCDKYGGSVQETQLYGTVFRLNEPVGVVGVACPDDSPLLAFVSLVAPAVARGNAVVVVPSEKHPTVPLSLYQILETSDLPGGVVNILTGSRDHLTKHLTEHQDVQAMWYFGSQEGSTFVEYKSAFNVKRTWVNHGLQRDWFSPEQGQGEEFLYHATQVKNVWLTIGDIFAN